MVHCKPLVIALKEGIEKRFPKMFSFEQAVIHAKEHIVASVCHPYFKLRWIFSAEDKLSAQELFLKALVRMAENTNSVSSVEQNQQVHHESVQSAAALAPVIAEDDFFGFSSQGVDDSQNDQIQAIRDEGLSYLKQSTPSADVSVLDILKKFPHVKELFCVTNAATPSSAPVERLFSCAGQIFLPRRNRVSDVTFEQLLYLKQNSAFL